VTNIRRVQSIEEIEAISKLMKRIWNFSDLEVIPIFEMKAVSTFGTVLGAYDSEDLANPIGFIYAFPKFPDRHHSHLMGIAPEHQGKNIGFLLKQYHRSIALDQSNPIINTIEWTVDPLLGYNATLNFHKLGVICNKYYNNYYGSSEGVGIYPSIPTDRFEVEWFIKSPRVKQRFNNHLEMKSLWKSLDDMFNDVSPLFESFFDGNIINCPGFDIDSNFLIKNQQICVEVPADFMKDIQHTKPEWALSWRLYFREVCQTLFSNAYTIVDFISFKINNNNRRRNFYIMTNKVEKYKY